ncbi:MAG: phosphoribosyltransferase family protein [Clostridia bacterium]|mgnify:FL=1|nr:phosphoribosyltransferase family protein [Clostridia bacterium]
MKYFTVDLHGYEAKLPIIPLPSGVNIAFFNLHGNVEMTEHCGKELAKLVSDCDVLLTAESKGLQLTHVIARELGHKYYAVARKAKKLYMQDGIEVAIQSSITTGREQKMYVSRHDVELMQGKKVGIIDDVVSSGNSLVGLEKLVELSGGTVCKKAFVLAEGKAAEREDISYLGVIPLL